MDDKIRAVIGAARTSAVFFQQVPVQNRHPHMTALVQAVAALNDAESQPQTQTEGYQPKPSEREPEPPTGGSSVQTKR